MRQVILAVVLLAVAVSAQSDGKGGWFCNYTAIGDEVVENAVPIQTFRTSGNNASTSTWCIGYCQDRTSLKATMRFQPAGPVFSPARYQRIIDTDMRGVRTKQLKLTKPGANFKPLKLSQADDEFCTNQQVAATVDAVFDKYGSMGIDTIADKLAYYTSDPNWAWLVYELVPDAGGLITTVNAFEDDNFCMKTMEINDDMYQVFGGYVASP